MQSESDAGLAPPLDAAHIPSRGAGPLVSRQSGNGDVGFSSPEAAALEQRLNFEMLLSELSARFSHLDEEDIDAEIERWLLRLIEVLGVDRSTFAELTPSG